MTAEQRLPILDGDDGQWGEILNQFIAKEHNDSGVHDVSNGGHKNITIVPGGTNAGMAPLKFTSGPLLSTPEPGAIEFNNDNLFLTQNTNNTRKTIAAYDDSSGAAGDIYYRDNNGNFVRIPIGLNSGQILTVNSGIPTWTTVLDGTNKITVSTSQPSSPTVGDLWIDAN